MKTTIEFNALDGLEIDNVITTLQKLKSTVVKNETFPIEVNVPLMPPSPFPPTFASATPSAPVEAPAAVAHVEGQLDSRGFPWDERIHSSSKNFKSDGSWTSKRNTQPVVKDQVEAELRAKGFGGNGAPAPSIVQPSAPVSVPVAPAAWNPSMNQPPVAPSFPQPPVQQAPPPAYIPPVAAAPALPPMPTDFNSMMGAITAHFSTGRITPEYLPQLCQRISTATSQPVSSITDISNNPDLVNYAISLLKFDGLVA